MQEFRFWTKVVAPAVKVLEQALQRNNMLDAVAAYDEIPIDESFQTLSMSQLGYVVVNCWRHLMRLGSFDQAIGIVGRFCDDSRFLTLSEFQRADYLELYGTAFLFNGNQRDASLQYGLAFAFAVRSRRTLCLNITASIVNWLSTVPEEQVIDSDLMAVVGLVQPVKSIKKLVIADSLITASNLKEVLRRRGFITQYEHILW